MAKTAQQEHARSVHAACTQRLPARRCRQDAFFKRLPAVVERVPVPVAQRKLMPALAKALEYGGAPPSALGTLLRIGETLPEEERAKQVRCPWVYGGGTRGACGLQESRGWPQRGRQAARCGGTPTPLPPEPEHGGTPTPPPPEPERGDTPTRPPPATRA